MQSYTRSSNIRGTTSYFPLKVPAVILSGVYLVVGPKEATLFNPFLHLGALAGQG